MSSIVAAIDRRPRVRLKSVALPVEHGSWGFLLEPLVAGVAIAPSPASPWIALLVIGAFLMRQPLKVIVSGWQSGRKLPQTEIAIRFAFAYAAIFVIGLSGSISSARPVSFVPFVLLIPSAVYQIYWDAKRNSRQLVPEIIGSIAISSSIAVIALADNWTYPKAFALWAIFAARIIPSILYVRNRLRIEKGKAFSRVAPNSAHVIALVAISVLAFYGLSPYLVVPMFAILLMRSVFGLSRYRRKIKAMQIGVWELIYGFMTVLLLVTGFYLNI